MKNTFRILFFAVSLCTLMVGTAAMAKTTCTPKHENVVTVEKGYITPAAIVIPPFSYKVDGVLKGIDPDILRHIAKLECLKLKNTTIAAAAAIQSVISGRRDMAIGAWYRTQQRAKVADLSYPTYLSYPVIWSKSGINTVKGLEGKRVGSVQGYLWTIGLMNVLGSNLVQYPNSLAMQNDLMAGRIDAAMAAAGVGTFAKGKGKLKGIEFKRAEPDSRVPSTQTPSQIGFPISKNNPSLLKAVNDDLKLLHKQGVIAKILEKYGVDGSAAKAGAPRLLNNK